MMKRLISPSQIVENKQKGQVALLSVLILFAVGTLVTVTGVLTTLDTVKNASIEKESTRALYLADGCLEEGFYRFKRSASYNGGNLNVDGGSCIITVNGLIEPYTISAEGIVGDQQRKVQASVTRVPFTITSWEEIK